MFSGFGKIGVICGGLSSERDISLKSGRSIFDALIKQGLDTEEIDLVSEDAKEVEEALRHSAINIAFVAMHGRFGEDGKLQAILESMDIPFVGSDSLASAFAMDKIISRRMFQDNNIPVPRYIVVNRHKRETLRKEDLHFPVVVKPQSQGSSIGISIVSQMTEIDSALDLSFRYNDNVIIEEYLKGRELTVGILDNLALTPIEVIPKNKFFDFQAKYDEGMTEYVLPAPIDSDLKDKIQRLSLKAHRILGCRHFSRVDLVLDEQDNPFILEVNTIPGFTSTSLLPKAALYEGVTFPRLCLKLMNMVVNDRTTLLKT